MMSDTYKTINGTSEGLYKEKGSKFIAKAFHVTSEDEIKEILQNVKKEYYDARHHCYAWRINPRNERTRSNDDGEPSGTAGKPILNQIFSFELYDILVIVIRYFGGTKLGVSGLINAYKTATKDALFNAETVIKEIRNSYHIEFDYVIMNSVMRVIKEEKLNIISQNFDNICKLKIEIKLSSIEKSTNRLLKIRGVKLEKL
jgi:uncharacterized YigZ family protein